MRSSLSAQKRQTFFLPKLFLPPFGLPSPRSPFRSNAMASSPPLPRSRLRTRRRRTRSRRASTILWFRTLSSSPHGHKGAPEDAPREWRSCLVWPAKVKGRAASFSTPIDIVHRLVDALGQDFLDGVGGHDHALLEQFA